jgi:prefoldin subunit 5
MEKTSTLKRIKNPESAAKAIALLEKRVAELEARLRKVEDYLRMDKV